MKLLTLVAIVALLGVAVAVEPIEELLDMNEENMNEDALLELEDEPSTLHKDGGYKEIPVADENARGAAEHIFKQLNLARSTCGKPAFNSFEVVYAATDAATSFRLMMVEIRADGKRENSFLATVAKIPAGIVWFKAVTMKAKSWTTKEVVPNPCTGETLAYSFADIKAHNANPDRTWDMEMHPAMLGRTTPAYATGEHAVNPADLAPENIDRWTVAEVEAGEEPPASYDFRTVNPGCRATNEVLDQGYCGSCYAQATATSFGASLYQASNRKINIKVSARDMADCTNGCDGGNANNVYNKQKVTGFPEEWCDPDTQKRESCGAACNNGVLWKASSFMWVYGDAKDLPALEKKIQQSIISYGPMYISFVVYTDFHAYSGGIYTYTSGTRAGGHAVTVVGWGEENGVKYWIMQNSWGKNWGEKGFFRIRRGTDECNIETRSIFYVVPDQKPTGLPAGCAADCQNGGSYLSDCTCKCNGAYTGQNCETCSISSCQNGGTFDAATCSCACPRSTSGADCSLIAVRLNTEEVCRDGSGEELSMSWTRPSMVGSYCAIFRASNQLTNHITFCGTEAAWSGANQKCATTGSSSFNMAEIRKLPVGTYSLKCAEFLGKNEFGQSRGYSWMAGFDAVDEITIKQSGCAGGNPTTAPTRAPTKAPAPTPAGTKCGKKNGKCALRTKCRGTALAIGCTGGLVCCEGTIVKEDEEAMMMDVDEESNEELDSALFNALYDESE